MHNNVFTFCFSGGRYIFVLLVETLIILEYKKYCSVLVCWVFFVLTFAAYFVFFCGEHSRDEGDIGSVR